jgi:hypothetical protein
MTNINLKTVPYNYNPLTETFSVSEKDVPFATEYNLISLIGNTKVFKFSHSTGPEFDPNTKWIYKADDRFILEVCNDAKQTAINAKNYLNAKLNN